MTPTQHLLLLLALVAVISLWMALSVAFAVVLGRVIEYRDSQVPTKVKSGTEYIKNGSN